MSNNSRQLPLLVTIPIKFMVHSVLINLSANSQSLFN